MIDELLYLVWSRVLRRPWSPDPWTRARQRKVFSVHMAERKAAEICARVAVLEELKHELLECVDELDAWAERAHWYAIEAERLHASSPWNGGAGVGGDVEVPITSRRWRWDDARRRYVCDELEEEVADHVE